MKNPIDKFERSVFKYVSHFPHLKNVLRDIYQFIRTNFRKGKAQNDKRIITIKNAFFGFHDRSPFSEDESKILANTIDPKSTESVSVGYYSGLNFEDYQQITKTTAYNWQQGCLSGWIPNTEMIFVNKIQNNTLCCVIYNKNVELKSFKVPFYAVSPNGLYSVTYDMVRQAYFQRGYGYRVSPNVLNPILNGLCMVLLKTEEIINIVTIDRICSFGEHIMTSSENSSICQPVFSPDSNHIAFIHRVKINKYKRDVTRLLVVDIHGLKIRELESLNYVSHFCWTSTDSIFAYCNLNEENGAFYHFQDIFSVNSSVTKIKDGYDGHPAFNEATRKIIIDSYPNRDRLQSLYEIDLDTAICKELGSFFSPLKFKNENRVDLHPRWSKTGNFICIDSSYTGVRSLTIIKNV